MSGRKFFIPFMPSVAISSSSFTSTSSNLPISSSVSTTSSSTSSVPPLNPQQNQQLLSEYQQYWRQQYDPNKPGLPLPATLQRERLLRRPGEWERMQQTRTEQIRQRSVQRAEERRKSLITERMKSNLLCQNLSLSEQRNIPSELVISLRVRNKRVCYRLDNLYAYLYGRYGADKGTWIDPFTEMAYSTEQQNEIETAFRRLFPCLGSNIREYNFQVEPMFESPLSHRIQIPHSLYMQILQRMNINANSPYIFIISNYPLGSSNQDNALRKVENSLAHFVGLEAISSHMGNTVRISPSLMSEMNLQIGDVVSLRECHGLPLAQKMTLRLLDKESLADVSENVREDVRLALENLISENYYALQVPENFVIEMYGQIFVFTLTNITTTDGRNVLAAINAAPGGLTLDLEIE